MKSTLFAALIFLTVACRTPNIAVGMSEGEFRKKFRSAQLVETSDDRTVYRVTMVEIGLGPVSKFYYFRESKLFRMDEGTRSPDITIETK